MPEPCVDERVAAAIGLVKDWLGRFVPKPKAMAELPEHFESLKWLPDDRIHKAPPGPGRANMRSATPEGFARAVFLANHRESVIKGLAA